MTTLFALAIAQVDPDREAALTHAFRPFADQIETWKERAATIRIVSADQVEDMKFARESRLGLRRVRIAIDRVREDLKAEPLKRGREIDGVAKSLMEAIEPIEYQLAQQEKFAERLLADARASLKAERVAALNALEVHPVAMPAALDTMSPEEWETCETTFRQAHESRLEAQRKAEAASAAEDKRLADEAEARRVEAARLDAERVERERVQAEENARLKQEADAREAELAEERRARETERLAAEAERLRLEQERQDAWDAEQRRIDEAFALAEAERQREREAAAAEAKRLADERQAEDDARLARERARLAQEAADRAREAAERQAAIDAERARADAALAENKRLRAEEKQRDALAKPLSMRYEKAIAALRTIGETQPASDAGALAIMTLEEIGETP